MFYERAKAEALSHDGGFSQRLRVSAALMFGVAALAPVTRSFACKATPLAAPKHGHQLVHGFGPRASPPRGLRHGNRSRRCRAPARRSAQSFTGKRSTVDRVLTALSGVHIT